MLRAPQESRTYFITTVTASRRRLFQVTQTADLLLDVLRVLREKRTLQLHAFVIMPDHVHLLLTPAPEISLEKLLQLIKGGFSFRLKSHGDVWQKSYDSRRITDRNDFKTHLLYIHQNPVADHLAQTPEAYPHSSANPAHLPDPPPPHFDTIPLSHP